MQNIIQQPLITINAELPPPVRPPPPSPRRRAPRTPVSKQKPANEITFFNKVIKPHSLDTKQDSDDCVIIEKPSIQEDQQSHDIQQHNDITVIEATSLNHQMLSDAKSETTNSLPQIEQPDLTEISTQSSETDTEPISQPIKLAPPKIASLLDISLGESPNIDLSGSNLSTFASFVDPVSNLSTNSQLSLINGYINESSNCSQNLNGVPTSRPFEGLVLNSDPLVSAMPTLSKSITRFCVV